MTDPALRTSLGSGSGPQRVIHSQVNQLNERYISEQRYQQQLDLQRRTVIALDRIACRFYALIVAVVGFSLAFLVLAQELLWVLRSGR